MNNVQYFNHFSAVPPLSSPRKRGPRGHSQGTSTENGAECQIKQDKFRGCGPWVPAFAGMTVGGSTNKTTMIWKALLANCRPGIHYLAALPHREEASSHA